MFFLKNFAIIGTLTTGYLLKRFLYKTFLMDVLLNNSYLIKLIKSRLSTESVFPVRIKSKNKIVCVLLTLFMLFIHIPFWASKNHF